MQFLLSKKFHRLTKLYHDILTKELPDLRSDNCVEIILLAYSRHQPFTHKDMANHLNIDKSRISILVEYLYKVGYVKSKINPEDNREHLILLTSKGYDIVPMIQEAITNANVIINCKLSSGHLNLFYSVLQQMEENMTVHLNL